MTKLSNLGLLTLFASSALACTVDRTQTVTSGYYFTGWVYDGVSNERLGVPVPGRTDVRELDRPFEQKIRDT